MNLVQFLLSLLASLLATVIFLVLAGTASRFFRRILTTIASEWLGIDVKYRFDNSRSASEDIKRTLKRSHVVRIFTSRGTDFVDGDLYDSLKERNNKRKIVRILLPDPRPQTNGIDWIDQRDQELASFDPVFGRGRLREQIRDNLIEIAKFRNPKFFEVQVYSAFHLGRIILTDNAAFFTPYGDRSHGREDPVYWYGKGEIYDMFTRLFEAYWKVSVEPDLPEIQ